MAEPNYVVEAFKLKGNLAFVAGGLIASALLSSGIAFGVVAGLEVFYLVSMSSNERFRRAIRALRR